MAPKPALNPHDYATLAALPTDPAALLTALAAGLDPVADPTADRSGALFGLIGYILRENVLPSDVTAGLLRAAGQLPGVAEVPGPDSVNGVPVLAVGRVDGTAREDILLDPVTKAFLGSRSVAIADTPSGVAQRMPAPGAEPEPPVAVGPIAHAGDILFVILRGNCLIVDAPGQTG